MKRIKPIFASLLLVTALGTASLLPTVNAQAPGPQGGGDTIKRPSCYPRCRPGGTTSATAASPTTTEEAKAEEATLLNLDGVVRFIILNLNLFI